MLNFAEFKTEFITDCRNLLTAIAASGVYQDVELEERSVAKAQRGELTGLLFKAPETICAPTFYVEDFYDMYKEGRSLEELSVTVVQDAYRYIHNPPLFPEIGPEALQEHGGFGVRLLNRSKNREYLKDIPHIEMTGLALIAEMRSGEFRAVITNGLLRSLGMTKDELFERAFEDAVSNDRATLYRISDMLCDPEDCENLLDKATGTVLPPPDSLYVLSNESCFWGAAALFYPGMLSRLTELMDGDFYVLPSSVHEVLLLPVYEGDPQNLADTIRAANRSVTDCDVFLSDELYICESGKLRQLSYGGIIPAPGILPS